MINERVVGPLPFGREDVANSGETIAARREEYDVIYLSVDPRLDLLRSRPKFQELLREGGWE